MDWHANALEIPQEEVLMYGTIVPLNRDRCSGPSPRQQKLIIASLQLAQTRLLAAKTNCTPVLLVDDLTSELDTKNQKRLLDYLENFPAQMFITSPNMDLHTHLPKAEVFHVEHGSVHRV